MCSIITSETDTTVEVLAFIDAVCAIVYDVKAKNNDNIKINKKDNARL